MNKESIIAELRQTQLFEGKLTIEPIEGGTINKSYRFRCNNDSFFVKTFELNHFAPTDRQALYFQQQRLAELERAPYPVYLSNGHDFQVEAWVEHLSLRDVDLDELEKVKILAATLADIHQLPPVATSIDLPKDWLIYIQQAGLEDDADISRELSSCRTAWVDTHKIDQVLCHNDLALEHISVSGDNAIFDWEYAALGNRYFDLAACALINKLPEEQVRQLKHHYAELADIELAEVEDKFAVQLPIVAFTNKLWYCAVNACVI